MTSIERAQKFHTDEVSLSRSGQCFWLVEVNFLRGTTNQKYYPDLASDTSSVWRFCRHFSDIISRGNQWWWREMSAVSQANIFSDLFSNSDDSLYGNWSNRMLTRFSRITRAWSSTLGQFSRGLCVLYTTRQNKMVNWQNPYLSGLVNLCDACLIEMRIWWVQAPGILSWLNTR